MHYNVGNYGSKNVSVKNIGSRESMVHQNYQNFIENTSNMIYIVALGVGLKCPRKIHLNIQCDGSGWRGQKFRKICQRLKWMVPKCTYRCVHHITLYMRATVLSVQKSFVLQMFEFRPKFFFFLLPALAPESRPSYSLP